MTTVAAALAAIDALPVHPPEALLAAGPLLVLAPHPDDESLGCGGLIAAAVQRGTPPMVVIVTDGGMSHPNSRAYPRRRLRATREAEARAAVAALGLPPDRIAFLGLRDAETPASGPEFDAAVTVIASLALRIDARTVLATWQHDPHWDHQSTHLMAAAAARDAGLRHVAYPVWGLTLPPAALLPGPLPTGMRIDVEPYLVQKRRAIAAHRTQIGGVIVDDPSGFTLPPEFLMLFDRPFEIVLDVP